MTKPTGDLVCFALHVWLCNSRVVDCVTLCDAFGLSEGRGRGGVEKPACHSCANTEPPTSSASSFALVCAVTRSQFQRVLADLRVCDGAPQTAIDALMDLFRVRVGGQEDVHYRRFLQQIDDICEEGHRSRFVDAVDKSSVEP